MKGNLNARAATGRERVDLLVIGSVPGAEVPIAF